MSTTEPRPNPDQLLAAVQQEEARAHRGKLRIFFGSSAGVGKTYTMLETARAMRSAGVDIVVGYVEPHGRPETQRLLEGLEILPPLPVRYRGIVRNEFDLDAALRRQPAILLVDELAHSNLTEGEPPPRHAKRWQDIEELLDAGIDVWTTVNVQHIESLNDLIARVTGVRQRETFPDRIFDEADEVELIDLPPDDLIARLRAGKVYVPQEAGVAIDRFFKPSNLIALRELALRRMADRVDASARAAMTTDLTSRAWMARDRLLAAIGPDEQAEQIVRAGKRIADALDAEWTVVYVETPELLSLPERERNRRVELLRLAETLGAETVTLDGRSAAQTILEYARMRRVTRLVIGAPKRRGLRALWRRSTTLAVLSSARDLDVITIAPAVAPTHPPAEGAGAGHLHAAAEVHAPRPVHWERYAWGLAVTALCTAVGYAMYPHFVLANIVMVYLLGATVAGLKLGRGPAVLCAVANALAFYIFFVQASFTLSVADAQYIVTLVVMLIVTIVIASLMASVRQQTRVAGARQRRTALLYAMTRELAGTRGSQRMALAAVAHVAEVFDCQAVVLLPDAAGRLHFPKDPPSPQSFRGADLSIAQWVLDHGHAAGLGSDTLPASPAVYSPLGDERRRLGVLAVLPRNPRRVLLPEQRRLLTTFAGQIGVALERTLLAEAAEAARVSAQAESLRNTLLASISHDLRTPLAVIAGASSTLAERGAALDNASRAALARSIEEKAREMSELVSNVLDLMRLESGRIALRRDWQTPDDLIGAALGRIDDRLADRPVSVDAPTDLPAVYVDAGLVVQVLLNLLDNAVKHTPAGTPIHIRARPSDNAVVITVEDEGPGLPEDELERVFDKFERGRGESAPAGAGLGLSICRAIVHAHGGEIRAAQRPGGGAQFSFTLPTRPPP